MGFVLDQGGLSSENSCPERFWGFFLTVILILGKPRSYEVEVLVRVLDIDTKVFARQLDPDSYASCAWLTRETITQIVVGSPTVGSLSELIKYFA